MRPEAQQGFCLEGGGLKQKQHFFAEKLSEERDNKVVAFGNGNPSKLNRCAVITYYNKIENEHQLKGTFRKQSNKLQKSQKTLLKQTKLNYELHLFDCFRNAPFKWCSCSILL